MESLRDLFSGLDPTPASRVRSLTPAPARSFAEELFEEGARAGGPQDSLARQVAALDSKPRTGMGEHLALEIERREYALQDNTDEIEFNLADLVDIVNPLHHIPVVANLYRELTGDEISGPARIAGDTLYGGPFGMLSGIVNAIAEEISGDDLGGTLIASVLGKDPQEEALLAKAVPVTPEAAKPPAPLAVSPESPPGRALTGKTALSALFNDLQTQTVQPAALPGLLPAASTTEQPTQAGVRAHPVASDPSVPPLNADAVAVRGFTAQMMLGLDKYRALAAERGGPGLPPREKADRGL